MQTQSFYQSSGVKNRNTRYKIINPEIQIHNLSRGLTDVFVHCTYKYIIFPLLTHSIAFY